MKKMMKVVSLLMVVLMLLSACAKETEVVTEEPKVEAKEEVKEDVKEEEKVVEEVKENLEPIRIGVIQPRSGNLAVSGEDSYWGSQIAFDLINERGGINGRMIEVVSADVPDATAAQNEVNRLIQNEGVKVITGIYGSAMAEVAGNLANRNDVLYWESISVTDRLTAKGYKGVFRIHINGSGFGYQAADIASRFAGDIGMAVEEMKVAIISVNNDFGQSVAAGVEQYARLSGMKVVLNELYDSKSTDTSPIILQLKNAEPDVVIATSYINDGIDLTKQAKTLDFNPKLYIGIGSGYGLPAYAEALGADADGMIDVDASQSPIYDTLDKDLADAVKEFEVRFEKVRGYKPPVVGYLTFQAAWVLAYEVIEKAGGDEDYEAMIAAAKSIDMQMGSLPTGAGVRFNDSGQNERAVLVAMQWQNGVLETIYPDYMASTEPIMIPRPSWSER
jgi:branched-chain amino acid transport system substrate-binding protein